MNFMPYNGKGELACEKEKVCITSCLMRKMQVTSPFLFILTGVVAIAVAPVFFLPLGICLYVTSCISRSSFERIQA